MNFLYDTVHRYVLYQFIFIIFEIKLKKYGRFLPIVPQGKFRDVLKISVHRSFVT